MRFGRNEGYIVKPQLNYVEYAAHDLLKTQVFFESVFEWEFTYYGEEYMSFSAVNAGLDGGFYKADLKAQQKQGSALMVFISQNLNETQAAIVDAGGTINIPTFEFPGGKRFHFIEPSGNEFAVWSIIKTGV